MQRMRNAQKGFFVMGTRIHVHTLCSDMPIWDKLLRIYVAFVHAAEDIGVAFEFPSVFLSFPGNFDRWNQNIFQIE